MKLSIHRSLVWVSAFFLVLTGCNNEPGKNITDQTETKTVSVHPEWSGQTNIYEVNLRQYSASGSIVEFEKHLPRLKDMGVEVLWFMPINPIGKEGRKMSESDLGSYYAVRNYKGFNEEFGTMEQWKAFVKHAQTMGFKVIIDWVANHSAPDNNWMKEHPDFYAKDSSGKIIIPFDWTDTRKLNYQNGALRDSMIAAMKFWVTETGIDGFRCDVAEEVPADFWRECISSLRQIKNVFMLAEGNKANLHEAGFDATYEWSMMHLMSELYKGSKSLKQFDSAVKADIRDFPASAYRMYFTTNHDENSWNGTEFEKYGDAYKTFAVFTQTMYRSIPLIYSGQENMNRKRLKFFVKDTISWQGGFPAAPFYKTLLTLRKTNPALAADASFARLSGSADSAVYAYQRAKDGHKVVVILNLSKYPQKFTIPGVAGEPLNVFMGTKEKITDSHQFSIEPWGYIVYDYN